MISFEEALTHLKKKVIYFYFICLSVLSACRYVCVPHACLVPVRTEEGIRSLEIGVPDGCEPPGWC